MRLLAGLTKASPWLFCLGVALGLMLIAAPLAGAGEDWRARLSALPITPDLGGATTRPVTNDQAFSFVSANAPRGRGRTFAFGNRLFNTNWTIAPGSVKSFDGLGPIFNRVSCSGCHLRDGRGRPPEAAGDPLLSMLLRLSVPGTDAHGGPLPVPNYGDQLGTHAIAGVAPEGKLTISYEEVAEAYGDGTPYSLRYPTYAVTDPGYGPLPDDLMASPRVAPFMIGLGLLEAVPEDVLIALSDPDDADGDGISGRINRVWNPVDGAMEAGRFGWKANQASLVAQNTGAALGDIGLTSAIHPDENCMVAQNDCADAPNGGAPELTPDFIERLTIYTQSLAVPAQRASDTAAVQRGAVAFRAMGCGSCHMPTLQTGAEAALPELANQTFHPFTDLLLHDMGPDLADNRPDFGASGSEWRTAPLWGLGLVPTVNQHALYLHDGRARGFAEAILWHGGEAEKAREAFRMAPAQLREDLLAFLGSL